MPSSRCNHIPLVVSVFRQLNPESVLDIGVGFGKWGHLFREYSDIIGAEHEPERYKKENWRVLIDGIEGYPTYLTAAHSFFYNNIYVGDMRQEIHKVGKYDLLFLGDVIEHIEKQEGIEFLRECLKHTNKALIVTTPEKETDQGAACGHALEVHRSFWTVEDFSQFGRYVAQITEGDILVAIVLKNNVPAPILESDPQKLIPHEKITNWRKFKSHFRPLKPALRKLGVIKAPAPEKPSEQEPFTSSQYWEQRYNSGGNSGIGSYGGLAQYKADVLNEFVQNKNVKSIIDFGCGDGNQLHFFQVPKYVGIEVSQTSIANLKHLYEKDATKQFVHYGNQLQFGNGDLHAEMGVSLDVIYHLVEDQTFDRYMRDLFTASERYVMIYSSNKTDENPAVHVKHRRFTDFISKNFPHWKLISEIKNPHANVSDANFFIFEKTKSAE
jgi:hypothetical protein